MEIPVATRYFCKRCLIQRRRQSLFAAAKARSHSTAGFAQLRSRRLLAVHGQDAAHFLQGLTTANIPTSGLLSSPANAQALYSAFMNAQGRLLNDTFIYPIHPQHALREIVTGGKEGSSSPAFLIEVDANQLARLQSVLKKYKLRAKASIRLIEEEEIGVFSVWSDGSSSGSGPTASSLSGQNLSSLLVAQDPRTPRPWQRILGSINDASQLAKATGPGLSSEHAYKIQRYLHGVPEGQAELVREETLLHEANIDLMHGVDFRKGCYVGQELVIRTQHTGVIRKRVMPVQVWTGQEPSAEEQHRVRPTLEANGRSLSDEKEVDQISTAHPLASLIGQNFKSQGGKRPDGKMLGMVGNLGLALCRLERVIETEELVTKARTKTLRLELSQWDLAGTSAWLKPFIPEWWQERGKIMEGGYESLKVKAPGGKN